MKRISTSIIMLFSSYAITFGQTYKTLVKETFETGAAEPSTTPATNIAPGTTNYTAITSHTTVSDGQYAIVLNPAGYDNFGNIPNAWQHGYDHTSADGKGYMMTVNANPGKQGEAKGSYYLYQSSAFDIPGAEYQISFWAANLDAYNLAARYPSLTFKNAYIGLSIRNTPDNTGTLYNSGTSTWVLPTATGNQNYIPWKNKTVNFTLPTTYNSPELYFNFYNSDNNSSTYGNDLALDDILIQMRVSSLSGSVFDDPNGNNIWDNGEKAINGSTTPVYVYLTKANGAIISKAQVQPDGTYSFSGDQGVPYVSANVGMQLILSDQNLNPGQSITASSIQGYISTGENSNGNANAFAGNADGIITLTSSTANISNVNFAIEQLPTANNNTTSPQPPSAQSISVDPASFGGTDPDGYITNVIITGMPVNANSITVDGATYTSSNFPAGGITIPALANGVPDVNTISIELSSSAPGNNIIISYNVTDNANKTSATAGTVTIPVSAQTLPVSLQGTLKVSTSKGQVRLDWTTLTEINNSGFEIDRSANGRDWTKLNFEASKAPNGNSSTAISYSSYDNQPLNGINYYLLKQIDLDGVPANIATAQISIDASGKISIYPSPAQAYIHVQGVSSGIISIYDAAGRKVISVNANTNGQNKIDIQSLSTGIYFVNTNEGRLKFIKQ